MSATRKLIDTIAYPPLLMDADHAAAHVCLSKSKFLELVDAGQAPAPVDLGGCPRWKTSALVAWVDRMNDYAKKPRKTLADLLESSRGSAQI